MPDTGTDVSQQPLQIKFGTDGWRGIIADDFTFENVRLVSQAVIDYWKRPDTVGDDSVIVGFDHRAQSDYFAVEVARVAAAAGLKPILSAQPCSSPSVSLMAKKLNARGGIMITASHNPPAFNGLKIKANYGGSASPSIISQIEHELNRLLAENARPNPPKSFESLIERRDFRIDYFAQLSSLVDLNAIRKAGFRIVSDAMFGSGTGYLSTILENAGVKDVIRIRSDRNPFFGGINPEPIPGNMGALSRAVIDNQADVGISVDGDADRVGAMDSLGRFVDSHRIFAVLLKHLVESRGWTGGIVKTFSTTVLIDKLAAQYNLPLYETPIGFKYICDYMLEKDILIGGEESGGIGVKNHIPERDGVLMGLLILEAMAIREMRLEELIDEIMEEFGQHEYSRIDMHPDPSKMPGIVAKLKAFHPESIAGQKVKEVSRKDGTKLIFQNDSWLLLRPSGTEPVVRVYSESSSQNQVAVNLDAGEDIVNTA